MTHFTAQAQRQVERLEQLPLNFNDRDAQGRVRIGPVAAARILALRAKKLLAGDRVEVVDDDGNRCVGVLHEDPAQPPGHRWSVELDWSTWRDADESTAGTADGQARSAGVAAPAQGAGTRRAATRG